MIAISQIILIAFWTVSMLEIEKIIQIKRKYEIIFCHLPKRKYIEEMNGSPVFVQIN